MRKLVFATNNSHKLEEVQAMVGNSISLITLQQAGCHDDIPEDGETFHENAAQKSHYVLKHFGMDCFADDSGLVVDELNGAPGVYSARYSGSRDMHQNMQLVLDNMEGKVNRKARFTCVICLSMDGKDHYFEGVTEGYLTTEARGADGFGYDPIFVPEGYNETFAEMAAAQKNAISHRAKAVEQLVAFLTASL